MFNKLLSVVLCLSSLVPLASLAANHKLGITLEMEDHHEWVEIDLYIDGKLHVIRSTPDREYHEFELSELNLLYPATLYIKNLRYKTVGYDSYEVFLADQKLCSFESRSKEDVKNSSLTMWFVNYTGCTKMLTYGSDRW
jgi:hypothetical protein